MVNSPLIRPAIYSGKRSFGGGTLDSHDSFLRHDCSSIYRNLASAQVFETWPPSTFNFTSAFLEAEVTMWGPGDPLEKKQFTLPETNSSPWKIHHFDGIYKETWGFPWAMLVYRRVVHIWGEKSMEKTK